MTKRDTPPGQPAPDTLAPDTLAPDIPAPDIPAPDTPPKGAFSRWVDAGIKRVANLQSGSLRIVLPDGRQIHLSGPAPGAEGVLLLHNYRPARRLATGGAVGFAESYLDGDWDSPDLATFLEVIAKNAEPVQEVFSANAFWRFIGQIGHTLNTNTKRGSRRNIAYHYDLGNSFYEAWLDPTMTYSSARFDRPDQSLTEAQENKYRSLAEQLGLRQGQSVLEIGCGWGGFAEFAAGRIGCQVTGVTISQEQYDFAQARIQNAGLQDRVDIQLKDYRDIDSRYDRVASIEMFEAVGEKYWPHYFAKLREVLAPGGLAGLQIITIDDKLFTPYKRSVDFIQKYIFPGGMLPSPGILADEVRKAGLTAMGKLTFGQDYALTLKTWRERFSKAWPRIEEMGFDERFRRMWTYYLAYCEAGFRAKTIDVGQFTLARPA